MIPPKTESDESRKRLRQTCTIERVTNGFTVRVFPDFYVFKTLKETVEFVENFYTKG